MEQTALRTDEKLGLGAAILLHVALLGALIFQPDRQEIVTKPQRVTVSLASEVSLQDTAPDPVAESRASVAPTLADEPQAVIPLDQPDPIPAPRPVATTPPPAAKPPRPQPAPKPAVRKPAPKPPAARTAPKPAPAKPASAKPAPAKPAPKPAGGSRLGSDFLAGSGDSSSSSETRVPASQIGASAKASLAQAITRQLKPHWTAPQGADAEQLVTILAFNLNPDGSLAGTPRVVSQSGETASNAPQKALHAERAIRAVQLAAPFDLPPEYYNGWKRVTAFRFDRKL